MIRNDENIMTFEMKVLEEVCRLAWADKLNEKTREELIFKLIPGHKANYRCCVYKEREIVRQRIQLFSNEDVISQEGIKTNADGAIVEVIPAACDECPLATYSVTDNCRFCLGKSCQNSCRFDAITKGPTRMHIDPMKCKECGQCAQSCPYGAIVHLQRPCKKACPVGAITYDEDGICRIDEKKCISCGQCVHSCPFGAISTKSHLVPIIRAIKAGKEVIPMCAPAIEGQFGEKVTLGVIRETLKKLGFADMVEVGLGGDMTAAYEAEEWAEAYKEGKKVTTSCCPAFRNMLIKHFPDLYEKNMSETVSPMCAISRYLKVTHPGCVTVFIGPCIAKKSEAADKSIEGNADYVMTFDELMPLLNSADISFEEEAEKYQESSAWGKGFASSGGVAGAVLECMQERGIDTSNIKLARCAGGAECKKTMMLLKAGRLPEDFVEGMVCNGGCVGGPGRRKTEAELLKARKALLAQADDRKILDNLKNYPMDKFSMYRDGHRD